jgi:4,5-dihydroxyphthalate decarboxylase
MEWYRRTGIFPIHGVVVVKNSVLEEHPHVGPAVYNAFKAARELYLEDLAANGPTYKDDNAVVRYQKLMNEPPLPFGFEANRKSIQALVDYAYELKIVPEHFSPEDIIVPTTHDLP